MARQQEFQMGSVTHQHMLSYANAASMTDLALNHPGGFQAATHLAGKAGKIRKSAIPVGAVKAVGNVPKGTKFKSRWN